MTLDLSGNLYGIDTVGVVSTIKQFNSPLSAGATGTTFAGGGSTSPTVLAGGASAAATSLNIGYIRRIQMDTLGNMYVATYLQQVIHKIDSSGLCSIVAGQYNVGGFSGDGGAATSATMNYVEDVAISALNGDLYIADSSNYRIRRVDGTTKIISTYAGDGTRTVAGNVAATSSGISTPTAVTLDTNENLYIADLWSYAILCVSKATGIISTIAGAVGGGGNTATGDGGPATSATLAYPWGVTYDKYGMLWISGGMNTGTLRMVDLTSKDKTITTVLTGMSLAPNNAFLSFGFVHYDENLLRRQPVLWPSIFVTRALTNNIVASLLHLTINTWLKQQSNATFNNHPPSIHL